MSRVALVSGYLGREVQHTYIVRIIIFTLLLWTNKKENRRSNTWIVYSFIYLGGLRCTCSMGCYSNCLLCEMHSCKISPKEVIKVISNNNFSWSLVIKSEVINAFAHFRFWLITVMILPSRAKIRFWLQFTVWCFNVIILQNNHSVIVHFALFSPMDLHWPMVQYNIWLLYFHMLNWGICFSQLRQTMQRVRASRSHSAGLWQSSACKCDVMKCQWMHPKCYM